MFEPRARGRLEHQAPAALVKLLRGSAVPSLMPIAEKRIPCDQSPAARLTSGADLLELGQSRTEYGRADQGGSTGDREVGRKHVVPSGARLSDLSTFVELHHGDVYDAHSTWLAVHGGFFLVATDWVQLDATVGTTFPDSGEGATPWGTLGVKLVFGPL